VVSPDNLSAAKRLIVGERRTTLFGRAAEMRELERAYGLAREKKQTRVVTIVGAAGIGKTRLVRDFLMRMRDVGQAPRVLRGAARDAGPAYEVFARVLRVRFGVAEGADPEVAKAQVRTELAAVLEDRKVGDVAYFLGQLLDLDFRDSPLIKSLASDPQQPRWMRRAVVKSFLEMDAAKGDEPLVLVFDDLHWAHGDSLELLSYLVENLRGPILVACMARPELLARLDGWARLGGERHKTLELPPLGEADASAVVQDLLAPCAGSGDLEPLVDEAVTLAGGNPALLEEIVRLYHETGVLEPAPEASEAGGTRWRVHADKLDHVQLPLTVQDAVVARMAALSPEERQLLERAAAMGSVFWLGGLVAIHRQTEPPPEVWEGGEGDDVALLRQLLAGLIERDYVLKLPDSTFAGDEEYVFKHNLEREALVRLTPSASERRYHRAVAEWLAFRENVDASEEYLEMLARHREKAGALGLAAAAYVQAGDVARARYANAKAGELYARGLALFDQCDHADEDLRMKALHHNGDVLQSLGRNDEAYSAFLEMLTRAWRLDLRSKGGAAHSRIGRLHRDMGRLDEANRHLTAALALFGRARDDRGIASTLDDIGRLHWLRGDYALALENTLRSLSMRRTMGDRRSIALSLNNLGLVHQDSGNFTPALEAFEQALRIRRDIGDLVGVSVTLNNLGAVAQELHDDTRALLLFQEAYEVAKETGDRNRIALVLTNLGETYNRLGDPEKALALLKQAEEMADELGDRLGLAEAVRGLGRAYLAQRNYTKARLCMQRAVELFAETDSKVQLGVALRALGEVIAAAGAGDEERGGPEHAEAAGHLRKSIAIFEDVGNQVQLARSSRAYADLLRQTPEHEQNPAIAAEVTLLTRRAEEILAKLHAARPAPERVPPPA
jgi:tetratricopeptide (TPR) repeat protein/type II secretory pathway predicted ATPase ExeA